MKIDDATNIRVRSLFEKSIMLNELWIRQGIDASESKDFGVQRIDGEWIQTDFRPPNSDLWRQHFTVYFVWYRADGKKIGGRFEIETWSTPFRGEWTIDDTLYEDNDSIRLFMVC